MGYFAISMNNTPSELIDTIKANLELYKLANKDNEYNYLLDMIQGDLQKLQDPKIFQESLDTLNNLDVNVFTGEVKLENKERK